MSRADLEARLETKRHLVAAWELERQDLDDRIERGNAEIREMERAKQDFEVELRSDYEMGEAAA